MKVLTVIGNRPQFVKAAAVSSPLRAVAEEVLVHTGQHFDDRLSAIFFAELGLPAPEIQLDISGGSNSSQAARMLSALEPVIAANAPDLVLVYGDTNSTLAGALTAVQHGVPVAHVEAGMRSFDRTMPEEVNRVLTDHLSSLLLCSTDTAVRNLAREGIGTAETGERVEPREPGEPGGEPPVRTRAPRTGSLTVADGGAAARVELVGDVMIDIASKVQSQARGRVELVRAHGVEPGGYVLATAHRAGNVDDPGRLAALVELLVGLGETIVLPIHPRTRARLREYGLDDRVATAAAIKFCDPVGYVEMAALLCHAMALVTDSGGLQKEAYLAGVRCLTMRANTEWTETVASGWNTLVDLDPAAAHAALASPLPVTRPQLYGDGQAGGRVVDALLGAFGS